ANITERYINSLPIGMDPYEVLGNPYLLPEENRQLDVNATYRSEKVLAQMNIFYSSINNFISSQINTSLKPQFGAPGVRQFVNIKEAVIYGGEWYVAHTISTNFRQSISLAYIHGTNKTMNMPLPEIAPLEIKYHITVSILKNTNAFTHLRYVGAQKRIANNFGERITGDFTTFDIGCKLNINQQLRTEFAINNIFNLAYREHLSRFIKPTLPLNSMGRNFLLTVAFEF
ncbi:MAG: TonB-dependent receptor domain-containing protein, partial [Chitinophagaceae bacterium]